MTVDATLVVIHHKATVIDGVAFEGFTEYRLVDARSRQN